MDHPSNPPQTTTLSRLPWRGIILGVWLVCGLAGAVGVWQRLTQGHLPAGYGSYVPWGLWIALYFHGVGMAGGVFVITALGYVLGWKGFTDHRSLRIAIVLSVAAILPAFLGVLLDLGHMGRSYRIMVSPSLTSMMAFNAWMYNFYLLIAAVCWVLSYKAYSVWLKPFLIVGIMLSTMFPSQSGAFFGVVDAKAFWHSALLPVLFFTSAVTAGAALLLVVRYLVSLSTPLPGNEHALSLLRRVVLGGLLLYFFFEFAEFSIALWNPVSHAPAIDLVLYGPYWWVFWIVHLLVGGVLALALLLRRMSMGSWIVGAGLVAVTFVSTRLNVLVPGQAVGEIHGLQEAFSHERLVYIYHATPMEYLVGLSLVSVGITVFYIGRVISDVVSTRLTALQG